MPDTVLTTHAATLRTSGTVFNSLSSDLRKQSAMRNQRKTPTEKKQLSYTKDHVLRTEYPKAFRRYWPRRKAQASQKERRYVRRHLTEGLREYHTDAQLDVPVRVIRRDQVRKWPGSAQPLGVHLAQRHAIRVYRTAWNFFKTPYDPDHHTARFQAFLDQMMQEQTPASRHLARMFQELLRPPIQLSDAQFSSHLDHRSRWLRAFVEHKPLWEQRLLMWIAQTLEQS